MAVSQYGPAQTRGVGGKAVGQTTGVASGDFNEPYPPGTTSTGDARMEACIEKLMAKGSSHEAALAACNVTMLQRKRIARGR